MELADTTPNPFALLITPDAVFAALNRSDRLNRLSSRICRPLDERQARLEGHRKPCCRDRRFRLDAATHAGQLIGSMR